MKLQLNIFTYFLFLNISFAQVSPKLVLNDKSELKLSKLYVNAEVSGQYVKVSYDMTFYNGRNRVLEGELSFPLAQGQTVSNLSMDLNGNLRDAVIIEKELGRVAYENTIAQHIDPALLEKTKGNNYKVRVYPIPAKGYKRIVISYEQNLIVTDGFYTLNLPFDFKHKLDEFDLKIIQNSEKSRPEVSSNYNDVLKFKTVRNSLVAKLKTDSITLDENLSIKFPVTDSYNLITEGEYFHFDQNFEMLPRRKENPSRITLLWDASFSMFYKDEDKELNLLNDYFQFIGNVDVHLIVFNNRVVENREFKIKDGDWKDLKTRLQNVVYDGGTAMGHLPIKLSDEIILVSDGMHNLGELKQVGRQRWYAINSLKSANHDFLENMVIASGGNYINLNRESEASGLIKLQNEPFQYLGTRGSNLVFETYPKENEVVNGSFALSGKFFEAEKLELLFGYNNEITKVVTIDFSKATPSTIAERLWAKQKLRFLSKSETKNKDAIIAHCKSHQLISSYTSMIVLDRIEDYVRFKIEPPTELMDQYKRLMTRSKQADIARQEQLKLRKERLKDDYKLLRDWYNTDFSSKTIMPKTPKVATTNTVTNTTQQTISNRTLLDSTKTIISGVVISENEPVPGVNVYVKGTTIGTQSDFDGKFAINADEGDELVFSFIGMKTVETEIGNATNLSIVLEEDEAALNEVVVTAYGISRRSTTTTSVTSISAESISNQPSAGFTQTLNGQVSGVEIKNDDNNGIGERLSIRGLSSISGNTDPLVVINGKVSDNGSFKKLAPSDIESISVLKDAGATAIYGGRGANGVLIVTTKDGRRKNQRAIKQLEAKLKKHTTLQPWEKNSSYIELLEEQDNIDIAYQLYLKLRLKFSNTPSFFLDVADFFESRNAKDYALTIATNLIEIELDNHEMIRALGYKLTEFEETELSVHVFKEVLELRPEEPQSYRDLALAYKENGEIEEALKLFKIIVDGDLLHKDETSKYHGIEHISYVELCDLIQNDDKSKELQNEFESIKTDIRIIMDWNHANTDLDLHVTNPNGDEIYYSNPTSTFGGRLSEDFTEGYGPESFMLKDAPKGDYKVGVKYYSDNVQKIIGPVNLKITLIKNFGSKNEERQVKVYRLTDKEGMLDAGTISI
ncbi:carboxypeptidase-like regulatory domain-containing protein [Winogradskyella maritima]|uniref:Carboxypeptidase-like regulatory domain-containing protein n=1 Tax=Winogradskyella maritima TaxID=1517766 RepID=A0ABV8AIR5_9FLAO|nr:carboxypeptidase-like regulatory domain-containing protein [Winogradskyella maritima]